MLNQNNFLTLTLVEKKSYLFGLISDIESTTNKQLIMCQKLLQVIKEPTTKLLLYIYDSIAEQLNRYTKNKQKSSQESFEKLKAYINSQEFLEQEHVEDILDQM